MASQWMDNWNYRHSLMCEEHGLQKIQESRKMPDGTRMAMGQLADNGQWVVLKQKNTGNDPQKRILPGEVVEFITIPEGVSRKVAYNTYIEVRDAAGLKPKPKTESAPESAEGETQGQEASDEGSETQGENIDELEPTAKKKAKASK